jgi:hypothetical protein
MQQLYDAVRATGATNLVIVSGNRYAATPPSLHVNGSDIVYGVHAYTCPNNLPPKCTTPHPYDASSILGRWTTFAADVPMLVSEFGWRSPADARYDHSVIAYAEAHGWGWAQFGWENGVWGPFSPFSSAGTGVPFEPSPAGSTALATYPGPAGTDGLFDELAGTWPPG